MATILISYRREDTGMMVGRICDRLREHFGSDRVMMDIDSIPYGLDFRKHIREALDRCDTMLAIIGPAWATASDEGQARLEDETDWVRIEVQGALARDIPVIPVLINGARMPKPQQLPEPLQDFAFRQATEIDMGRDFHAHMDRLIRVMDQLLVDIGADQAEDAQTAQREEDQQRPKAKAQHAKASTPEEPRAKTQGAATKSEAATAAGKGQAADKPEAEGARRRTPAIKTAFGLFAIASLLFLAFVFDNFDFRYGDPSTIQVVSLLYYGAAVVVCILGIAKLPAYRVVMFIGVLVGAGMATWTLGMSSLITFDEISIAWVIATVAYLGLSVFVLRKA